MDLKIAALVLLALLSGFFFHYFLLQPEDSVPVSADEFSKSLVDAKDVFIMMDLRSSTADSRNAIMQCGVDLAGSVNLAAARLGIPEKNVSSFVMDDSACLGMGWNGTIAQCQETAKSGTAIYLMHGSGKITYYKNRMVVELQNYTSPCSITLKKTR